MLSEGPLRGHPDVPPNSDYASLQSRLGDPVHVPHDGQKEGGHIPLGKLHVRKPEPSEDVLQEKLDMLILKALSLQPMLVRRS
jgi:hypothetical protein